MSKEYARVSSAGQRCRCGGAPGDRRRRRLGRDDLVGTGRGKSRGYTLLAVFLLPEIALYIARKRALWTHSV